MRVLAALSGGVDSAVAAARCRDAGHDVVGVHLALSPSPEASRVGARGCCSQEDSRDARRVADTLEVPFYVWDVAERFRSEVVEDFVAEYAAGRTPNPCLRCNERIKFAAVLERAVALGFDAVATGHYARLVPDGDGVQLHRAVDATKDQAYVLAVLEQEQLRRALFPLGESCKSDVRAEAATRGLLVANKPDSHDICFVSDGDTPGFLRRRLGSAPGTVVDTEGVEVGRHDGTYRFTVGQRRGLDVGVPAADGRPRYVLSIEPTQRTVTVGPASLLDVARIRAERVRWCGRSCGEAFRADVQIRAHGAAVAATVYPAGGGWTVIPDEPVRAVAPGQAVVAYVGSRVLGSATIVSTTPFAASAAVAKVER